MILQRRRIDPLFLVWTLLCLCLPATAAVTAEGAVGDWTNHVNSDNLNFVFAGGGYVWCATSGGALRFDPATQEFAKIVRDRPGSLVSNNLSCVAVTDGNLRWFGTRGLGLNLLQNGTWTLFTAGITDLPSNDVNTLASYGSTLWVGTRQGLALVEGATIVRTFTVANTGGQIPSNVINDVFATDDTVWCATTGGVSRGVKSGTSWNWTALNAGLSSVVSYSVALFDGKPWVACNDGTYEYDGSAWVKRGSLPFNLVLDLKQAGTGFYAAAGDSGVLVWQAGSWALATPAGFGGRFRHLAADGLGRLYCASSRGLVLYDGSGWSRMMAPGPAFNYTEDVAVSPDGVAWTATRSNLAALRYEDGEWSYYDDVTTGGQFQRAWVFSVFPQDPATVWFGHCCCTECRVDRLTVTGEIEEWDAFSLINCKDITRDESGIVWFSSDEHGVYSYDPSDGSTSNVLASVGRLSSNRVEAVAPLDSRRRWVGHMIAGLDYWDDRGTLDTADDSWKRFTTSEGLASMSVTSVALVGTRAYVGTLSGISVFEDTLWSRNYDSADLSPASDEISEVAADRFGNVWVATSNGVAVIGASGDISVYTYETSGLVDNQVLCVAVDDAKGEVWFGTPNGISVLDAWGQAEGRDLDDVFVYPNPLRPSSAGEVFRVGGLPYEAEASVFDLSGRRLRNLGLVANGGVLWDGTDSGGSLVPTGAYLIVFEAAGSSSVKKVAVIR